MLSVDKINRLEKDNNILIAIVNKLNNRLYSIENDLKEYKLNNDISIIDNILSYINIADCEVIDDITHLSTL